MILYHGTDIDLACKIKSEGFKQNNNEQHWLGNGIYFFKDYALAEWWTQKPSINFGIKAQNPAIVVCEFEESLNTLDLARLDHYTKFCKIFQDEFWPMYLSNHPDENLSWNLRCTYCDYLHEVYDLDAIIGNFYIPDQPYQPKDRDNLLGEFCIEYVETQICVFKKEKIKLINIEEFQNKNSILEEKHSDKSIAEAFASVCIKNQIKFFQ